MPDNRPETPLYTAADMDAEIVNISGALMQFVGGLPSDLLMLLMGMGM